MARKEKFVTITREGRDKGRQYVITELSATAAELWAARAFLGMVKGGVDVPPELTQQGMKGLHVLSTLGMELLAKIDMDTLEELFEKQMTCVQYVSNPSQPASRRALLEDDIEEIATRMELRMAWLGLHFDFFVPAEPSTPDASAEALSN